MASTAAANRIKALASLLAEDDHEDDDDWMEERVNISRAKVRDRRNNLLQKGHHNNIAASTFRASASVGKQTMEPEQRDLTALQSKPEPKLFDEKSPSCIPVETTTTSGMVKNAELPSASTSSSGTTANGPNPTSSSNATSTTAAQRRWKREQHGVDEENEPCDNTRLSTTAAPNLTLPSPSTEPTTKAQPKSTTFFVAEAATSSISSPTLNSTSSPTKQIVFGRPDTFGAAGMGTATCDNDDSYYMPNVKERARALSHWKLTKKDKNGYQRALEWKRSCCGDNDGRGDDGDPGRSTMNVQVGIGGSFSNASTSSGDSSRSQEDGDGNGHEDIDEIVPNIKGSGSDSSSLAAALTIKKASAPCFLEKFVQLLEEDEIDKGGLGGKQHQKDNGEQSKLKPAESSIRVKQDHENTVNGGVPAPSPRKNGMMMSSPRAVLSPRNGVDSKSSKGAASNIAQSPKVSKINKSAMSKTTNTQYHLLSNVPVVKNNSHAMIPKSPRIQVNVGTSRSSTKTAGTSKTRNGRSTVYQVEERDRAVKVDHRYDTHRDVYDDKEDDARAMDDDDDAHVDEVAVPARLETCGLSVEANDIPREVKLDKFNGDEKSLDGSPIDREIKTMTSTDSIIEEAMNFLQTPLFDSDSPIGRHPQNSGKDEENPYNNPQQEQYMDYEEDSCESELLEVAERFALSLDRFLVGADDITEVNGFQPHATTTEDDAKTNGLENRISSETLSIGDISNESQDDQCDWVGWIETPRYNDGNVHSSFFPITVSCDEPGRPYSMMNVSESVVDGAFGLSQASHGDTFFPSTVQSKTSDMTRRSKVSQSTTVINNDAADDARKPPKIKICIDGAPEFANSDDNSMTADKETTFFVASQPSPSCGDDARLLLGQSSSMPPTPTICVPASAASAAGQGNIAGKQSTRKLNLKRFVNNNVNSSVTSKSLFGPLSDDHSETNESICIDTSSSVMCETEITKGKYFTFVPLAATLAKDTSPQNGFVANFDSKTLSTGLSISSSTDSDECAAPVLASKAKKMIKRMKGSTRFLGKNKRMNAFGSLDDAEP